jgi:hypothetical protein
MGRKPNLKDEKRAVVSPEAYAKYLEMRETLKRRDVSNFTFAQYFDLIFTKITPQLFSQIIEEATPKDYKIKLALQDDELKDEILRLLEAREKKRLKEKPTEAVN